MRCLQVAVIEMCRKSLEPPLDAIDVDAARPVEALVDDITRALHGRGLNS